MCRSEPQIAQAVTLMMASRGCSILGSGTSSQRMSPLPCQAKAFICCSFFCRCAAVWVVNVQLLYPFGPRENSLLPPSSNYATCHYNFIKNAPQQTGAL